MGNLAMVYRGTKILNTFTTALKECFPANEIAVPVADPVTMRAQQLADVAIDRNLAAVAPISSV
jgi:hydroxypyruvate isomerase